MLSEEEIIKTLQSSQAIGFKPYRTYSKTGDITNCRITDFMSEKHLKIADKKNLIVMMHLSKKYGVADDENISDLIFLSEKYPNVKCTFLALGQSYHQNHT